MRRLKQGRGRFAYTFCTLLLIGCGGGGGGGDDGGGPNAQVGAYNFTSQNMVDAAGLSVSDSGVYPVVTNLLVALAEQVGAVGAPRVVSAQIPVGDLGVCASGTATLVWDDADDNGALSPGDAAMITLGDCVLDEAQVNGTMNLGVEAVDLPTTLGGTLTLQVTIEENVDGESVTGGLNMKCGVLATASDVDADTVVYSFQAADEILTATMSGAVVRQFSCGDVTLSLSFSNPTTFLLSPVGVVNDPAVGLLTIVSPEGGGLFFVQGDGGGFYPENGTWRLLSMGECAAFGAPDGVGDSTGSYIDVTALEGDADDMQIDLYDVEDTLLDTQFRSFSEIY